MSRNNHFCSIILYVYPLLCLLLNFLLLVLKFARNTISSDLLFYIHITQYLHVHSYKSYTLVIICSTHNQYTGIERGMRQQHLKYTVYTIFVLYYNAIIIQYFYDFIIRIATKNKYLATYFLNSNIAYSDMFHTKIKTLYG